jgi:hypothetical protein
LRPLPISFWHCVACTALPVVTRRFTAIILHYCDCPTAILLICILLPTEFFLLNYTATTALSAAICGNYCGDGGRAITNEELLEDV